MDNQFRIIIPVYNSEKWIEKCLNSICLQSYPNWRAIIVNDASTDNTLEVIKKTLNNKINKNNFKLFARSVNVGALENTIFGTNVMCSNDEDIIVVVDGDDWLIDSEVLSFLNQIYQDPNIWLTYGNYINSSTGNKSYLNKQVINTRTYRKMQDYTTSHLRTYKFKIWKRIKDADFRNDFGKYYTITGDLAVMFPLIEMAGVNRIKFIDKPLYVYNDENSINDHKKNASYQLQVNSELRKKQNYEEIP